MQNHLFGPGAPLISPERLKRPDRASTGPASPQAHARTATHRTLESELRSVVEGEVRFDDSSRAMYSLDASNYRHIPVGVVVPRSRADVISTVAIARTYGAPIVSRAGGTGLAGQTVNEAVVLDFSKYMNRILDLDSIGRFARVEPGVVCDQLDKAAAVHQLTFGPRPATHDRCGFGGMLGNNSCGSYAQMAGKAVDNTEELEVLLYDGTVMTVGWMTDPELDAAIARGGREGQVYAELKALRQRWAADIAARYPKLPRRVSGYNLDQLVAGQDGRFNVARALVGSESTLVTILSAKVRLVWNHPERVLVVLGYGSIYEAADRVVDIVAFDPIALEGFDDVLRRNLEIKRAPSRGHLQDLPKGCGWLFVEFGDESKDKALASARAMIGRLRGLRPPPVDLEVVAEDSRRMALWRVRESALGAESFVPGKPATWPGWEDSAVRPELVGGYLRDLRALYERYDYHPALYGHFGMGCVHCSVAFDLATREGIAKYRRFAYEAAQLVASYDGSLSGEHGDGQSRSELLPIMFGPGLVEAFREYKRVWDPDGKMNPRKIVDPYPLDSNLRLGPDYRPWQPDTYFKYPDDHGSFAHATMRCIGIGKCRRSSANEPNEDVMCPSFMVTHEEKHTTRGRAHLLHEMMQNKASPIDDGWRDENVKEALDLCLSCKGCKSDCPVNVDMATYKAEFLAHYYEGRLRPRQAYAFGWIDRWARLASLAPGLVNLATQTPGLRALSKMAAGMAARRRIPAFAEQTFQAWFARRAPSEGTGGPRVVLWADTFNNYFHPEVAADAVRVLESAGYRVVVPGGHLCCGRPLYDFGFLPAARRYLERVLARLAPHIEARDPVVVLEPSCASVLRDELRGLLPERDDARRLSEQTVVLSELLAKSTTGWVPPTLHRKAIGQGHCHHKSVLGFDDEKRLLERMGVDFELLASGCCGMAGSFGFEEGEKYRVSMAQGERVLLPAVREADDTTLVIADGFSCRTQIEQATHRRGLHLAQVIALALDEGPSGPSTRRAPEAAIAARRTAAVRASMVRSAVTIATAAAGWIALRRLLRMLRS